MFCTTLNYIYLRILGEGPDGGEDNACARARKWILDHGGVYTNTLLGQDLAFGINNTHSFSNMIILKFIYNIAYFLFQNVLLN